MKPFDRLYHETGAAREHFLSIPLVQQALSSGGSLELYIAFLTQAYHHVKHTFPLLALAASRTPHEDYQVALLDYMQEERGHEKWILNDIRALGGDADAVEAGPPGIACQVMVGHAYYVIEHVSPYAMLGMVHVLEGLSVLLAHKVAGVVQQSIGATGAEGFSYLNSHGSLDVEHVEMFRNLVNRMTDRATQDILISSANIFYRLYGAIFEELGIQFGENSHAA